MGGEGIYAMSKEKGGVLFFSCCDKTPHSVSKIQALALLLRSGDPHLGAPPSGTGKPRCSAPAS